MQKNTANLLSKMESNVPNSSWLKFPSFRGNLVREAVGVGTVVDWNVVSMVGVGWWGLG